MSERDAIKEARKYYKLVKIIPEATEAEKEYNKAIFIKQGRPEEYTAFYNRAMVKRYELYTTNFSIEYYDPIIIYTLEDLKTLINFDAQIEEANEQCNFEEAGELMLQQADFLQVITPPEAYQKTTQAPF